MHLLPWLFLQALERHGLRYEQLETLAGVSAGSIIAAMLSVGCTADELFDLVQALPFHRIADPELGALSRVAFISILSILGSFKLQNLLGPRVMSFFEHEFNKCNGPGINSGAVLQDLIAEVLPAVGVMFRVGVVFVIWRMVLCCAVPCSAVLSCDAVLCCIAPCHVAL